MSKMLECDYLVIGTGASGMAFADAIVSHSSDRTVIMVDKLPEPGGHWNHAYGFVRLHQAACFYGVASEKLERDGETALYKYKDLSSKKELLTYFRYVMDKLVKTGRVFHFGECTYNHDGWDDESNLKDGPMPIQSFVDKEGTIHQVRVKRRVVDGTYLKIAVPSVTPPKYDVDPSVECVPINDINTIPDVTKKFIVVGAGKTGIDAVLHLLDSGVDPAGITWVMPRDSWFINRVFFDPQKVVLSYGIWVNEETSLRDNLLKQEKEGLLMRLDETIWPDKYCCATVEEEELEKLRSIRNVIRLGHVASITKNHLVMSGKDGKSPQKIPYDKGSLVVDCSSRGLPPRPEVPIFQGRKIVLQPIQMCMICISAATAGYVECHEGFKNDNDRNSSMIPISYPNSNKGYLRNDMLSFRNVLMGVGMDPRTKDWYDSCRLNMESHTSFLTLIRVLAGDTLKWFVRLPASVEAKKRYYKSEFGGEEFEYQIFSPEKIDEVIKGLQIARLCLIAFGIGLVVVFSFGLRFLKNAWFSDFGI